MPRTLPTELEEALENNSFSDVYIRAFFYVNFSDTTPTFTMTTVKKYKLTGKTLSIEGIYDYLVDDFDQLGFVVLRRGVVANGTPSYIDTARFAIRKGKVDGDFLKVESYILADHNATFTTTNTRNAIDNFSAEYGFIAVGPADGIYNNQFNSTGLVFVNHPEQFEVMLKQKFINFCENGFNIVTGNNQLRFYDVRLDPWNNYPTTITLENIVERIFNQPVIFSVGLRWVDENGVVQGYSGTELPIFNIGFLKTGDTLPTQPGIWTTNKIKAIPMSVTPIILPMNLNYQDGDLLQFVGHKGVIATGSILVTEYLDLKENPSWGIKIEFWDYIGNTEGGSLSNRDIIRYASIDPSEFENNLDETITNVQLLAKAVDVLNLGGESYTPPATTAANDFQLGDGAGSWVTKTLAQAKTILGVFADAASDSIYYVRRNATWTNAKTYFDTLYAALSHAHAASDITSGTVATSRLGSGSASSSTYLRGDQTWATPAGGGTLPAFSVHKNGTDQGSVASGTPTKLTWSTEVYDTNNNFASDKFTPTVAGKYLFIISIRLVEALGAANYFNANLYKNGSAECRSAIPVIVTTHPYPHAFGTFLVDANGSTDYFEVYVHHDSPSGNRTVYGLSLDTFFQGYLAIPA